MKTKLAVFLIFILFTAAAFGSVTYYCPKCGSTDIVETTLGREQNKQNLVPMTQRPYIHQQNAVYITHTHRATCQQCGFTVEWEQ